MINFFSAGVVESGFTTASKKPILIPSTKPNETNVNKKCLFVDKPAIKLNFQQQSDIQPTNVHQSNVQSPNDQQSNVQPVLKKRKNNEDSETIEDCNNNNLNSTFNRQKTKLDDYIFNNCTFNNCSFDITLTQCNSKHNS